MSQWTHKLTFTTALFCILGNKIIIVISGHFRPLELLGAILLSYLRNTVLNLGKRKDQLRTNQPFYFNFIAEKIVKGISRDSNDVNDSNDQQ